MKFFTSALVALAAASTATAFAPATSKCFLVAL